MHRLRKDEYMPRPRGGSGRSELVRLAIVGIDAQIQDLMDKREQLAKLASGAVTVAPEVHTNGGVTRVAVTRSEVVPAKKKKRVVSAETRKKLKKAAKARWAKARAERR
jgi:hypothetical protein